MPARAIVLSRSKSRSESVIVITKKKTVIVTDDDDGPTRIVRPEVREKLKKRNLSAITLFLTDWKLQTFNDVSIVPDPNDEIGRRVRYFTDLNMFLYVVMITLVMLTFNVGGYLVFFLRDSIVGQEAIRFLSDFSMYSSFNIWVMSSLPFCMASTFIIVLAYYDPENWNKRTLKSIIVFRYGFTFFVLLYVFISIFYWAWNLRHVESFVKGKIFNSFDLYANEKVEKARIVWEFTQKAFDCCGVNSYQDFLGTKLGSSKSAVIAYNDSDGGTPLLVPIVVIGFPFVCCDITRNKVCLTNPRDKEVFPIGCLKRTVTWIQVVIGGILCLNFVNFILGVTTTVFFTHIDRSLYALAAAGMVDVERKVVLVEEPVRPVQDEELGNQVAVIPKIKPAPKRRTIKFPKQGKRWREK